MVIFISTIIIDMSIVLWHIISAFHYPGWRIVCPEFMKYHDEKITIFFMSNYVLQMFYAVKLRLSCFLRFSNLFIGLPASFNCSVGLSAKPLLDFQQVSIECLVVFLSKSGLQYFFSVKMWFSFVSSVKMEFSIIVFQSKCFFNCFFCH